MLTTRNKIMEGEATKLSTITRNDSLQKKSCLIRPADSKFNDEIVVTTTATIARSLASQSARTHQLVACNEYMSEYIVISLPR